MKENETKQSDLYLKYPHVSASGDDGHCGLAIASLVENSTSISKVTNRVASTVLFES